MKNKSIWFVETCPLRKILLHKRIYFRHFYFGQTVITAKLSKEAHNSCPKKSILRITALCLFVCCCYCPTPEFSLTWRRHHCRWRAANFDLCSALMAIEQWGFFNVPHLLQHGPTVYNGHHHGPVTLTPIAERLAVELSLPVFTT